MRSFANSPARKVFDFFVFSSLFIACCSVLMTWQAAGLFRLPASADLLLFVFCGTVSSYNFHWFLTPPRAEARTLKLRWAIRNHTVHGLLFLLGIAGSLVLFIRLREHWLAISFSIVLAFLYSAPMISHPLFAILRRIAVGKTIFLSASWTYVTALLPLLVAGAELGNDAILYIVNRFYFIYALCILFDYRDRKQDRKAGIRSMITLLDEKGIDRLFWGSVAAALLTNGLLAMYLSAAATMALFIPLLLLSLLYPSSKRITSDYRYYFVLDGLMMLSAPLLILFKFAG